MNTRQLIDKIMNKWPAKVICLLLAIFLYIFHQVSLVDKKSFVIPLQIIDQGNVMQVGDCPSHVTVIVRAAADDINTIVNSDLKASINLNNITESGEITVPVSITVDEKLLAFDPLEIKIKPDYVTLNVDKKISKFVPIVPSVSGEVAEGYMITNIEVNPSSVGIIGPEAIVNKIENIQTDALVVSNAEKNFTDEVIYFETNKLIFVQDKGPYKATVSVEPQPMEKEYTNIHIVPRGLAENLMIEDEIPNIDFKVSGTVPILGKYILGLNSVIIDLSEIAEPGSYNIPVRLLLPNNIILESKSFESVLVNIIEKPEGLDNTEEKVENEKIGS